MSPAEIQRSDEISLRAAEHARDERLRWHCRRALLELDIVFSRFWALQGERALEVGEAESLTRLLALEDHALWDLVSGRDQTLTNELMLERLRAL